MTFSADMARFVAKTQRRTLDVFHGVAFLAHESITKGTPITGAPGQIVDTGTLRNSYQMSWETPLRVQIASGLSYAGVLEHGVRRGVKINQRQPVGGFHSIKLTVAGFGKIVSHVNRTTPGAP